VIASSELLAVWERGEGEPALLRTIALLPATDAGDALSLPIGARDASLLDLRESLFGPRFNGVTSCPQCGESIELTFDSDDVRRDALHGTTVEVERDGFFIAARLPNSGDLLAIGSSGDLHDARERLFERCVVRATRDDESIAASELPAEIAEDVVAAMAAADPQADVTIDLDCPTCGCAWREPFDVAAFLWIEIAAAARRLMTDIHRLATAYGWSEAEILRLSPARRGAYLEMVP
jgi:hypothetical protein